MKTTTFASTLILVLFAAGCDDRPPTTEEKQAQQQAQALEQAHQKIGMPAIGNFSEKRMMKDLYELRDKPFPTHTYIVNEQQGCLIYFGASVGYGLPYATQYTSPTRTDLVHITNGGGYSVQQVPQPEPNGLFMPTSAEGTWVMLKDPNSDDVKPVYVEPRVVVSPFKLPNGECPKRETAAAPKASK